MAWKVELTKRAEKALVKLPRKQQSLVAKAIDEITEDPFAGDVQSLKGSNWRGYYRRRVGNYRLIFSVDHIEQSVVIRILRARNKRTYK